MASKEDSREKINAEEQIGLAEMSENLSTSCGKETTPEQGTNNKTCEKDASETENRTDINDTDDVKNVKESLEIRNCSEEIKSTKNSIQNHEDLKQAKENDKNNEITESSDDKENSIEREKVKIDDKFTEKVDKVKDTLKNDKDDTHTKSCDTLFKKNLQKSGVLNQLECNSIVEPLLFPDTNDSGVEEEISEDSLFTDDEIPCLFCNFAEKNCSEKSQQDYLCHLILEHNLVIADVKLIADLRKYAVYWKKRLQDKPLSEFCVVIKTETFSKESDANYNMLCDALPEDRELREKLHVEKLKQLLDTQTKERGDLEFQRMCLFCSKLFTGNRLSLFSHMNEDHNFNIGHPDNIVNVYEFLEKVEEKLVENLCLFCEKSFKDRAALREHMRKKAHRRLNPKNKVYDKYYIINYLELGKTWETLHAENDPIDFTDDWSGWDEESQNAVCFFCEDSFGSPEDVYSHMEHHGFDFGSLRKEMHLSFYQQIKMINYIRREVHKMNELNIDDSAEPKNADDKAKHIVDQIKSSTKWNQPQYYFPTYENDSLLCQLEDKEGLFEPEDTFVVGEDGIDCKAIINESVLTDLVVGGYFD